MILTVTPNPSLDRTYEVPSLERGEVIRATGERMDPGGKGVNVSRAVAAAGRRTVAEGGAYLNNHRVEDPELVPTHADLVAGSWLVLRRGKKRFAGVEVAAERVTPL